MGPLPLVSEKEGENGEADGDGKLANGTTGKAQLPSTNRPAVLADGSYATQVLHMAPLFRQIENRGP